MRGLAELHLGASGSTAVVGKNLFNRKWDFIAHSLSLSLFHRPYMTETLLKRT